jgi:hypothetical protein
MKCVLLIRYGILPRDYDELPVDVSTWLLPVQQTINYIENEARQDTHQQARNAHGYHGR